LEKDIRIVVIGGVSSSEILLRMLKKHFFKNVTVFAHKPENSVNVSSYVDLGLISEILEYKYFYFKNISESIKKIQNIKPDILFAVGISQIIPIEILSHIKLCSIGFHPTCLPKGRGRAPLAWLILEKEKFGASTFFIMNEGVDDGSILVSERFYLNPKDDAEIAYEKMLIAEGKALERLLPKLHNYKSLAIEQDHNKANYFGKRSLDDGNINWHKNVEEIECLIRATTKPHPGAFTFQEKKKIIIWKADVIEKNIRGIIGKILIIDNNCFVVQTGYGLLKVTKWECLNWYPRVGMQLGYNQECELNSLKNNIETINERLARIEKYIPERLS